jgi:predicted dehydrogenase
MWRGATPEVEYMENRVHPQDGYGRPGWLRCEQFGAGMITGWGTHHIDIAHWGMGTEHTGPIEIEATAEFPESGLWDVHGAYDVRTRYANGVTMRISDKYPNGVRFEGDDGWIFVARGKTRVTASDPVSDDAGNQSLRVSDPKILAMEIGPNDIHLYESPDIHLDWLQCIRTRRPAATTAEQSHRSCTACLLAHMAMKLPRKLNWDPVRERFIDDPQADSMLSRPERPPFGLKYL